MSTGWKLKGGRELKLGKKLACPHFGHGKARFACRPPVNTASHSLKMVIYSGNGNFPKLLHYWKLHFHSLQKLVSSTRLADVDAMFLFALFSRLLELTDPAIHFVSTSPTLCGSRCKH